MQHSFSIQPRTSLSKFAYNEPEIRKNLGARDAIQQLLSSAVDPNKEQNFETPLCMAAQYGRVEVARMLVENHASVNLPKSGGCTPLMSAAGAGHVAALRTLVGKSATIDALDANGLVERFDRRGTEPFELIRARSRLYRSQ